MFYGAVARALAATAMINTEKDAFGKRWRRSSLKRPNWLLTGGRFSRTHWIDEAVSQIHTKCTLFLFFISIFVTWMSLTTDTAPKLLFSWAKCDIFFFIRSVTITIKIINTRCIVISANKHNLFYLIYYFGICQSCQFFVVLIVSKSIFRKNAIIIVEKYVFSLWKSGNFTDK